MNSSPQIQNIKEHLQFLEPLLDQFEAGIMLVDRERNIHWFNPIMAMMGFCQQGLGSHEHNGLININDEKCENCPIKIVCQNPGEHLYFSRQHQDAVTAQKKTYSTFTHSLPESSDEPRCDLIVVKDISEQEVTFKQKQELQLILSNVLENTVDAVITLNAKGEIHSWNRGAWMVFGYTKEEIRGRHVGKLIPEEEESQKEFEDMMSLLEDQGFVRNHRARMISKIQGPIDVAVTLTTMRTMEGDAFGYSLIIRNITKVVHLEQSLSQKVRQLEKLLQLDDVIKRATTLEEIFNAILVVVTAGQGLRFNRAYLFRVDPYVNKLVGECAVGPSSGEEANQIYSKEIQEPLTLAEIIAERSQSGENVDVVVNEQIRKVEISLNKVDNPLVRCLESNRPYLYISGGSDDHHLNPLFENIQSEQFVAVPLVWQDHPLGVILADNFINRLDITMDDVQVLSTFANRVASAISNVKLKEDLQIKVEELKSAYQSLSESQESTVQKEKLAALGEVSSKVAHEIRNPLSTMGGFARLIDKQSTSAENKQYAKIIYGEAERLENILAEILDYVKKPDLDRDPFNVNDLIISSLDMVKTKKRSRNITIDLELDSKITTILLNGNQIKQIFINLIQNAMDAMGRSGVLTIKTSMERFYVVISISDTGVGIPEEHLEKLFNAFFTTKSSGVGLGLSISKDIIARHNGRIDVESKAGEGTTFIIRLPKEKKEITHD